MERREWVKTTNKADALSRATEKAMAKRRRMMMMMMNSKNPYLKLSKAVQSSCEMLGKVVWYRSHPNDLRRQVKDLKTKKTKMKV